MDRWLGRVVLEGMTPENLSAQLTKFADADLRKARKEGFLYVTGTKQGLVAVRFEQGVYEISTQGVDAKTLAKGDVKTVRPVLVSLYNVTFA